jgi:hypothetical protein
MLWSLKWCGENIILPNPREWTITTLSCKCFHPICYPHHRRVTECYAPISFTCILPLLPYPCPQIRSRTFRKPIPRVMFSFCS